MRWVNGDRWPKGTHRRTNEMGESSETKLSKGEKKGLAKERFASMTSQIRGGCD